MQLRKTTKGEIVVAGFRAKQIRTIWSLTPSRYEYIMTRMGIEPEEAFYGTGYSHVFSFENLLDFGFAHFACSMGLKPNTTRAMLSLLHRLDEQLWTLDPPRNVYMNDNPIDLALHHVTYPDCTFFVLSGEAATSELAKDLYPDEGFGTDATDKMMSLNLQRRDEQLADAMGYVTVNIGSIKREACEGMKEL
jgi:hypothetical protein